MTKFQKQMLTIAAAGALTAVTALPAMAFENEFHGFYKLRMFESNYEQYGGGNPLTTQANHYINPPAGNSYTSTYTGGDLKSNNYFEQRARIFYTAKASDDLMLKTGFELDAAWGSNAQTSASTQALGNFGRNQGGGLDTDAVSLETKWVYLDFKIPSTPTRVTAGLQAFKDSIKGILFDFDGAGLMTSTKLGNFTINAGYIRGYDNNLFSTAAKNNTLGNEDLDIAALELKWGLSKTTNVGLLYYLYSDGRRESIVSTTGAVPPAYTYTNRSEMAINTLGLTGETQLGPVTLSGFLAAQIGNIHPAPGAFTANAPVSAFAYNLAAKAAVGPGKLRTALLFTSGNDYSESTGAKNHQSGWVSIDQSQGGAWGSTVGINSYNESGMMLLNRNALAQSGTTDNAIVYNSGNGPTPTTAQGLYLATLGYDATITPKLYTNVNVGAAWAAKTNNQKPYDRATGAANGTNYMGTEVNMEIGYKMYPNLTASIGAAYVLLGGYYNNSANVPAGAAPKTPDNPYTGRLTLAYTF